MVRIKLASMKKVTAFRIMPTIQEGCLDYQKKEE